MRPFFLQLKTWFVTRLPLSQPGAAGADISFSHAAAT
jgi:hypothetical protein